MVGRAGFEPATNWLKVNGIPPYSIDFTKITAKSGISSNNY